MDNPRFTAIRLFVIISLLGIFYLKDVSSIPTPGKNPNHHRNVNNLNPAEETPTVLASTSEPRNEPNDTREEEVKSSTRNENDDTTISTTSTSTTEKKKKNDKKKKKPTSSSSSSLSPSKSTTLLRIQKEYKDAIMTGIAFDWSRGKRLLTKPTKKKKKNKKGKNATTTEAEEEEEELIMLLGPLGNSMRHWHFSFRGCGVYEDGIYHGRIVLPDDYPASPPRVQLWTPSGRFVPGEDICLSASAYHPESWTPKWTIPGLVQALRLHMVTSPREIGSMTSTWEESRELAKKSLTWNLRWNVGRSSFYVDHSELSRFFFLRENKMKKKKKKQQQEQREAEKEAEEKNETEEEAGAENETEKIAEEDDTME